MNRKLMRAVIGVVVAASISGGGYFLWSKKFSGAARAEDVVRRTLVDPDSAKFEGTEFSSKTGGACGYVHSKNRMGGYVGLTMFVVTKDGDVSFEPNDNTDVEDAQERLKALEKKLAFLKKAQKHCNDSQESAASAPK